MAVITYQPSRAHAYGQTAGSLLLNAMEAAGTDPFTSDDAFSEATLLGLSRQHTVVILHRMAEGGQLTRIRRGLYAINGPVTRLPKAHPFAVATAVVTPSAVSHWSALQHWGLTEQVPLAVTVSSPSRVSSPVTAPSQLGRPAWMVAGVHYESVTIPASRFFGTTSVWVSERNQVRLFDRERALLDAFHHFHVFGSLAAGLEILEIHLPDIDLGALANYAVQLRVAAVAKRIGWALERLGVPDSALEPLRAYPSRGESPLDPGLPARGHHNRHWDVIENLGSDDLQK